MTVPTLQLKRRIVTGGAPSSLSVGELAFDAVNDILYAGDNNGVMPVAYGTAATAQHGKLGLGATLTDATALLQVAGDIVVGSGNSYRVALPTQSFSACAATTGGTLAGGTYQCTVVVVDWNGGLTMYPAATAVVVDGVTNTAITMSLSFVSTSYSSYRYYVSAPGGSVPDRYFASGSAGPVVVTTLTGATIAALPTAPSAYATSIGSDGTSSYIGLNGSGSYNQFYLQNNTSAKVAFGLSGTTGYVGSTNATAMQIETAGVARVYCAATGLTTIYSGLTVNDNPINNVGDPLVAQDAATKHFVNSVSNAAPPASDPVTTDRPHSQINYLNSMGYSPAAAVFSARNFI